MVAVWEVHLRVCFFKKIKDWILKSERIQKWILFFFTKQINPRSLRSWCIKGTDDSILDKDSSFLFYLMHDNPRDIGLICLINNCKICFWMNSCTFKDPIFDFLKEMRHKFPKHQFSYFFHWTLWLTQWQEHYKLLVHKEIKS